MMQPQGYTLETCPATSPNQQGASMLDIALNVGDIYKLKNVRKHIYLQIANGRDALVFSSGSEITESSSVDMMFRLPVVVQDIKKNWARIGKFDLYPEARGYSSYYENDIGTSKQYVTCLEDPDRRIEVDETEIQGMEKLAFHSTIHIVKRLKKLGFDLEDWNDSNA
ncbi:MAG: hypothetical protein AAGE37_08660 [Pseudomonadota bacterium]